MELRVNALCMSCVLSGATALGQVAVPILNPGFETDFAGPCSFPVRVPTNWQLHDPGAIIDQSLDATGILNPGGSTFYPGGAPEGTRVALIFLSGDIATTPVGLWQQSPATLVAGRRYMLRVRVGNIASGVCPPPFQGFYNLTGFPGYAVQLLAGTAGNHVVIAEDRNTLAPTLDDGEFAETFVTVVLPSGHPLLGQPLAVRLMNLNQRATQENPGIEVNFDFVRLTQVNCAADFNADGIVDFFDYLDFVDAFSSQSNADFNVDGAIDFFDYLDFVDAFSGGC